MAVPELEDRSPSLALTTLAGQLPALLTCLQGLEPACRKPLEVMAP